LQNPEEIEESTLGFHWEIREKRYHDRMNNNLQFELKVEHTP
jgi:hypothetical protein